MSIVSRSDLSPATRAALIEAAIHEYAASGFDGASTRAIATRAGVHQPQINYHFASKAELWRAAVASLFDELQGEIAAAMRGVRGQRATLEVGIRAFVRHAARRPELNRIMVRESGAPSERLEWLVSTYVQQRYNVVAALWEPLRRRREVIDVDSLTAFYLMLGGGTLLYTNSPEARLISGTDPAEPDRIEAHATALIAMLTTRRT
jgi:AcrR family transcriptional regulator